MPKQTKTCRVCGKEYEACRSIKTGDTVFNWREVACSPECGKEYLQRVMTSRSATQRSCDAVKVDEVSGRRVSHKKKLASVTPVSDIDAGSANEDTSSDDKCHEE